MALWNLSGTTRGEPVPEETFTHSHSSWSSIIPSAFSMYYEPWHPPYSIHVLCSLFPQSLSKFSLVYLLAWYPPLHTPYISSPNHCLLFAAHAHTIATCSIVVTPSRRHKRTNFNTKSDLSFWLLRRKKFLMKKWQGSGERAAKPAFVHTGERTAQQAFIGERAALPAFTGERTAFTGKHLRDSCWKKRILRQCKECDLWYSPCRRGLIFLL